MGRYGVLETTTIREFDGGLNVVTNDLNMETKYSKIETNVFNNINGTKAKRYGTKYFTDINANYEYILSDATTTSLSTNTYYTKQPEVKIPVGTKVQVANTSGGTTKEFEVSVSNRTDLQFEGVDNIGTGTKYITYSIRKYQNGEITTTEYKNIQINVTKMETVSLIGLSKEQFEILDNFSVGMCIYCKINGEYEKNYVQKVSEKYIYLTSKSDITEFMIKTNESINGDKIINATYYSNSLIAVTDTGNVLRINGQGVAFCIFNAEIDKIINIDNTKTGWSNTYSVCFAVFNGILTIWNGTDKPLFVDYSKQVVCNYLIDEGTMSNVFVPRAKYALAFNHYLVCANIIDDDGVYHSDRLSISSRDTIGTFYSGDIDDISNDAVYEDLGKIISSNNQEIKGLSRYRNELVIGFDNCCVFGTLGKYEEIAVTTASGDTTKQIHTPSFDDVVDNHGCISNRTFMAIQSELVCLDYSGLPNFRRGNLSSAVIPSRISTLIAPELYDAYKDLSELAIEERIFSVLNPKDNQYLLFIPNNSDSYLTTETVCYAYTLRNGSQSSARDGAWSKFIGWNFEWGCTSALNTVFLGHNNKIYTLGNINEQYFADYMDDPDYPPVDEEDISGKAIDFDWELPWAEFGDRTGTKYSRYISTSTNGTAKFTIDFYTDYIYYDNELEQKDPTLTMDFVAGDAPGWGNGLQNYGAGRRTNTEKLFAWTAPFKIAKLRLFGSSKYKLNINNITLYYQKGNIRR